MNTMNKHAQHHEAPSREDRLYDLSVLLALVAVAMMCIFMHNEPILSVLTYAPIVGSCLCMPWFFHHYKKSGKDKATAKTMLNAIALYPALAAVIFSAIIRCGMWVINYLMTFL